MVVWDFSSVCRISHKMFSKENPIAVFIFSLCFSDFFLVLLVFVFSFLSSSFPSNSHITSIFTCMLSLTRIMAEISHYCWPYDRNSVHCNVTWHCFAPNCQELLKEVSESVMATGHYNTYMLLLKVTEHIMCYCCCCSINCWISVFFFPLVFSALKVFSSLASLSIGCEMLLTFLSMRSFI